MLTDETFRRRRVPLCIRYLHRARWPTREKKKEGWSLPGFNAADWKGVTATDFGYGNLKPRSCEPVKAVEELPAAEILRTPLGETVVDMGVNIAGRIRMTVRGPAGTKVTLEHSETLNEKGNFINNIAGRNKDQTDVYILKGGGEEVFEPRFTYHGFRYVRLTGYPGEPDRKNFTGIVLSSATEMTGEFSTSDGRLNKLQENIVRSQRGNMFSIPTDCPQRERAGWLGDIQVFGATAAFNAGVDAFLSSWLDCVALERWRTARCLSSSLTWTLTASNLAGRVFAHRFFRLLG